MSSLAAENSSLPQPLLIERKMELSHTPFISGAQRHSQGGDHQTQTDIRIGNADLRNGARSHSNQGPRIIRQLSHR